CMGRNSFRKNPPPLSAPAPGHPVVGALLAAGRACLAIVALATCFLLIGCQEATIDHYQVHKDRRVARRMLVAIVGHGQRNWFFKLSGPQAQVDKHEKEFEQFIQSVAFTDKPERPMTWTTPKGWREEAGTKMRHATFKFGSKESPLELIITPLGGD